MNVIQPIATDTARNDQTSPQEPVRPSLPSEQHGTGALGAKTRSELKGGAGRILIPLVAIALALVLVLYASGRWEAWRGAAAIQTTDNATVRAEMTRLSARVAGNVRDVHVQDYQPVRAGDLLVQIDPADYEAQVAQAQASAGAARATLDNLANQKELQRATIAQAEAQRLSSVAKELQTRQEQERQRALMATSAGTRQKLEQATAEHDSATANLAASEATIRAQLRQLDVLDGQEAQLEANVQAAQAALAAARLKLAYTRIVAPFDGVVGERQVQPGDYVNVGSNLIAVIPLPNVYVTANYKETQLTRVAPGQAADVTVDTFPGEVLHGHVARISPASGSTFALLPPDNASGNFTKVVQRISVRIEFEPDQPLLARLRPGMSVVASIRVNERDGSARADARWAVLSERE
ncbi:MAG TPA: HlyD family secretion protein [Ancylobacter sp.]